MENVVLLLNRTTIFGADNKHD